MIILNKFEAIEFSPELINDFVLLFNQSFTKGRRVDHNTIQKIFGDDNDYLGYLAYDNKKPVAFFGAIKLDFVYNQEVIKIAQSVSSMVLPGYRKYNLFYHLATLTFELAQKENVKFMFGLPNTPELFHSLLDWTYLGPMKKYSFKIKTLPLAKIFWKIYAIRKLYLFYFKFFTLFLRKPINSTLNVKNGIDNNFYIPRSPEYINYKRKLGAQVLTVNATTIIISLDYRIKIGDLEDISLNQFVLLVKTLKRICFWLGIDEICFSVDSHSKWNEILGINYKTKDEIQLMYYPLDQNYKLDFAHITLADYDTF